VDAAERLQADHVSVQRTCVHSDQRYIRFTYFEQKIVQVHLAKDVERQTQRCRCDVAWQRSPLNIKEATKKSQKVPRNK
jgi:hypothetical protein